MPDTPDDAPRPADAAVSKNRRITERPPPTALERTRASFTALRLQYGQLGFPLLAILPALWLSLPLLRDTPLSYDHATHLFKAWHFLNEMLLRGRLHGWSHFWAFGTPSDELTPFGSEAWVVLFRFLTLGQLSWLRTYSLSFAGLMLFKSLAAYRFSRSYLGPAAAVGCAWLTMLDPGGQLEGGWEWHTYWGVWPVTLAMSLTLLALTKLEQVLREGHVRDVFWAGAWVAAALLTHQMALLALAIAVPLLLLDHALRPNGLDLGNAARGVGALAFGGALSAFFLLPFFARSGQAQDLGWLGEGLAVTSQKLLELRTFQNVWIPVHGLGLLGGWLVLRRRVPGGVFLATAAAVLVLLSSGLLLRDLHLERVMPSLIKIEANRFLLVAKLFWFALAGYAMTELLRPLLGVAAPRRGWRSLLGWGLGAGLGLGLLAPSWRLVYDTQIDKKIVGEAERRYWGDLQKVLAWTAELRQSTDEHYRIAYHNWRGEHLPTIAPVFDQTLMYKIGYTPVQIFDRVPMTDETALLEQLSVKYVISSYPLKLPHLSEERRFGTFRVYRFENYRPEPFHLLGPGHGELLEFSPDRIRLRLTGTSLESRLVLHVASFPRWEATSGGDVLPIATVPALGAEYPVLMEVPARDGELTFEYVYRRVDWAGLVISWAALPVFLAIAWLSRRRPWLDGFVARLQRLSRPIGWAALAALVTLTGSVAAGTRTRRKMLPAASIFQHLHPGDMTLGGEPCTETAPLNFKCGDQRVKADVVSGVWGIHLCIAAPDAGELRVRSAITLGSFLAGNYDPVKEGAGNILINLDGQELGNIATRPNYLRYQHIQLDTRERKGERTTLELVLTGTARNCFDLDIVE